MQDRLLSPKISASLIRNFKRSMFSVLNAKSLKEVDRKKLPHVAPARDVPKINQRYIKIKNIVGATARSRNGCLMCKHKRRKCDESHPLCGFCVQKNFNCVYKESSDKNQLWSPSSTISTFVSDSGAFYVNYFQVHVTDLLCLSLSNHYKRLFCMLANYEESFAHVIAAWGALHYKKNTVDNEVSLFLKKSMSKFTENFPDSDTKFTLYFKICYYLILVSFNICVGEKGLWYRYLKLCQECILSAGGLQKLCEDFDYSHDVRFLVSNFQYHDVLSSTSLADGTLIPTQEYHSVFNHPHFKDKEVSYGIDTLQGCSQPVILLLGDIMNMKVHIANSDDTYYRKTVSYVLTARIDQIQPTEGILQLLNPSEMKLHECCFEMYRICCKLNLMLYINLQAPGTAEIQELVAKELDLIESVMHGSRFQVTICLPLLMCGICSIDDSTKSRVTEIFEKMSITCPVPNISKCWEVTKLSWKLNSEGSLIVDWSAICKKFNWYINVC